MIVFHDYRRVLRKDRPRFSLRSLLVVQALVAVIFAVGYYVRAMQREFERRDKLRQASIATINAIGLVRDDDGELRIILSGPKVSDSTLSVLTNVAADIVELDLGYSSITDASAQAINDLPNLRQLRLPYTNVTNAFCLAIRDHPSLWQIDLAGTDVDDEGVSHLCKLPLIWLDLRGSKVTDDSLSQLKKVNTLQYLDIRDTKVTAKALEAYRTLKFGSTIYGPDGLR